MVQPMVLSSNQMVCLQRIVLYDDFYGEAPPHTLIQIAIHGHDVLKMKRLINGNTEWVRFRSIFAKSEASKGVSERGDLMKELLSHIRSRICRRFTFSDGAARVNILQRLLVLIYPSFSRSVEYTLVK
jgi:hypothetical protein